MTNINALYWTENIFFLFGEDILKLYALEVILTWKLCISLFNEYI